MNRMAGALIAVTPALFLTACANRSSTSQEDRAAISTKNFSEFADAYFASYFDFNPSEGTSVGLHEYDNRLEDRKTSRIESRVGELKNQLAALEQLRKNQLRPDDTVDATLLDNRLRAELLDLETIRVWRSPLYYAGMPGNSVDLLMKRNFAPAMERLQSVTARMQQMPALIDAMEDNVKEPPREFTDLALRVVNSSIPFFRDEIPVWAKAAAGSNEKLLSDFNEANRKVVTALGVMSQHLERNVIPLSSGRYAIGVDAFSKKLRYEEMVDIPLDRLLQTGQARLEQDYRAFIETARLVAPGRSAREAVSVLSARHPSEDKLMEFASNTLESARQFVVDHRIVPIPSEERAKVQPTPPYARSGSFASMDTPGPYEKKAAEAFYYVTPTEPAWTAEHKLQHLKLYNAPVMDIITVHEAYPGHYVQFLYAKQFPTKTRKLTACGTNAEGWAHYAEQMMVEEGFRDRDPKIRLAQLAEALVRDARYVSGIQLHTAGWSVEDSTQLFMEKAFMERENALQEARRGTYNPTYLYYTLGKLQIYKLREDYKRAKGAGYSMADFHQQFVRQGAIPIPLIRQILLPGDTSPSL